VSPHHAVHLAMSAARPPAWRIRVGVALALRRAREATRARAWEDTMGFVSRTVVGLGLALVPCSAHAELGIAFVHGTGRQTDAYRDYWTADFVDPIASALPDPDNVVVVNCDFEQYMWHDDAAGCLAGQLLELVDGQGVDELVVVTHSNGANVVRWILSNPTYDPRYPRIIDAIRWVDALAPSSLGTPLADAAVDGTTFERSVGWLFGYGSDAVTMQQTSTMALYNSQWLLGTEGRPELPVGFWTVVGTDVDSSPFDGFLECSSQAGAGDVWRYDHQFTKDGEALSHAQSRRACFGLESLVRADMEEAGS
jgi:hypothetical protein